MAVWKHFIILFGGFYDPGIMSKYTSVSNLQSDIPLSFALARYLNDLWVFDMQEYKWTQIELKESDARPSYVIWSFLIVIDLQMDWTDHEAVFRFCHALTEYFCMVR